MCKKLISIITVGVLTATLMVGCTSSNQGGTAEKNADTTTKQTAQEFNPDTDSGAVEYKDMRKSLGDMPKIDGTVKLGAVSKAFENEYWRTLKEGMEKGVKDFKDAGMDISIDVKAAQSEGDEQGQLSIVSDMINKKYSALLLSPISDGNLVPGVENALKANIPVVNVNDGIIAEAPNYVGPRAIQNGELAAEWISNKLGGKGKVAIVVGMPKAFAARQRTEGFETWMKKNASGIEIVEKQNADWDRSKAKELAEIWIKNHSDLNAIFCNNDTMALGVQEAVNESGKDILVVGVDGIGEAYDSIKKGELDATIDSFPMYKGQIAVEATLRVLGGQKLPRVIWTPQALIDSKNVNTPAEKIIGWESLASSNK